MSTTPRLTVEEENRLALRWREQRDRAAFEALFEAHRGFVFHIVRHSVRSHQHVFEDLIQEGYLGLMKAIDKFEPQHGVRLASYAHWWIRASIFQFIERDGQIIGFTNDRVGRKLFWGLHRVQRDLENAGVEVTPEAIASALRLPLARVIELLPRIAKRDTSIDQCYDARDDMSAVARMLISEQPDPEEIVRDEQEKEQLRTLLRASLNSLPPRLALVIKRRFLVARPDTLQQLGERMGLTRERVRQLQNAALKRLRLLAVAA